MKNLSLVIFHPFAMAFALEWRVDNKAQLESTPGQIILGGSTSHGDASPATLKPMS